MLDYRTFSITTIDNPFNPFDDFENWFLFDCEKNYYTLNKLARLSKVDDSMTEKEESKEIERAIERLIEIDPLDIYIKVYKKDSKQPKNEENNDITDGYNQDDQ